MRKKLIEVALPLDAINTASAREKSIRHGHPSTLHLWWARRPLAAARAVIFAQMVDDPSEYVDVLLSDPATKRAAQRALKKRMAGRVAVAGVSSATGRSPAGMGEMRHYGRWMRDEAQKRIGHLYPPVEITPAVVQERPDLKLYEGRKLTVIAWLWARTVKSPNPAFADVDVPLASTFMLSTKKGGYRHHSCADTR